MGQHWYDKDGSPQHFRPDGTDTTLRDARKHGYFPSVTGILDTLDKPGLNRWKLRQVVQACFDDKKLGLGDGVFENYYSRMMDYAFAESDAARDRGSEIHDAMEAIWLHRALRCPDDIRDIAGAACNAIIEYTGQRHFVPEATVVSFQGGYGGMIDLHNDDWLLDYKTKDISDSEWKKAQAGQKVRLAYPEHAMQLAAYNQALNEFGIATEAQTDMPERRCANVFVDRQIPGRVIIHEWTTDEIRLALRKFNLLCQYWQLDKNYTPGES